MKNRLNMALIALFTVLFILLFFALANARAQTTPILGGRLQSDLDAGGHLITNLHESFLTLIGGARLADETVTFQGEVEVLGNNLVLGDNGGRLYDGGVVGGEFPGLLSFEELLLSFGALGGAGTLSSGGGTNAWTLNRGLDVGGERLSAASVLADDGAGGTVLLESGKVWFNEGGWVGDSWFSGGEFAGLLTFEEKFLSFGPGHEDGTLSAGGGTTAWTLNRGLDLAGPLAVSWPATTGVLPAGVSISNSNPGVSGSYYVASDYQGVGFGSTYTLMGMSSGYFVAGVVSGHLAHAGGILVYPWEYGATPTWTNYFALRSPSSFDLRSLLLDNIVASGTVTAASTKEVAPRASADPFTVLSYGDWITNFPYRTWLEFSYEVFVDGVDSNAFLTVDRAHAGVTNSFRYGVGGNGSEFTHRGAALLPLQPGARFRITQSNPSAFIDEIRIYHD